ncbi:MAG: citrate synthase [Bacteroidia bacterium]
MADSINLTVGDKTVNLPVIVGTENEKGIDISSLLSTTGCVTFDIGYKNTGATKSGITFLDGDLGILRYRGYPIDQLAGQASFMEVCYLVLNGELPTKAQLADFEANVSANYALPAEVVTVLNALPNSLHPMGMLSIIFNTLNGVYPDDLDYNAPEEVQMKNVYRLLGHMPAIVAAIYRKISNLPLVDADPSLDYCNQFFHLMNGQVNSTLAETLNTLLILHADHEQNCSTSTVRIIGSSHSSLFASVAGGNNALWGPLHGGANQEVLEMLNEIHSEGLTPEAFMVEVKNKTRRLMGFGHRVYKNFDPRASVIKRYCDVVLEKLNIENPLLGLAQSLEKIALADEYFVSRKLYPNVDFYSGIIYSAIGIPVEMFTVMFAFGRLPGWVSQWRELKTAKEPIGRPRQIYTGATERNYVGIENR